MQAQNTMNKQSKECTKCGLEKPVAKFNWRKTGVRRQSWCKKCKQAYQRQHYKNNRSHYRKKGAQSKKKAKASAILAVGRFLEKNPCVECGESDIRTLHFDHLRDKERNVSKLIIDGYGIKRIFAEIDKCQVLCANCHSIKSSEDRRDWRSYYHAGMI